MKKKIISLVLAVVMIAAFMPAAMAASVVDSGKFGENVTWMLDDNGVLIISGTGSIGANFPERSPFYENSNIKSVAVEYGITEIGNSAFDGCDNLTSVDLPDSVTEIGSDAFDGCISLKDITIPNSVTEIGSGAFRGCISLTDITIPDSVVDIGSYAFDDCAGLKNINVSENNGHYFSIDGNLFGKDFGTELLQYAIGKKDTSYTIPAGVKIIGSAAFRGCGSLASITIPGSVTEIKTCAFEDCIALSGIAIPTGVTEMSTSAFDGCVSLTDINVSEGNKNYCSIDGNLFSKDRTTLIRYAVGKKDTSYTVPDYVTNIEGSAFFGCINLNSITVPNSVTDIGESAFHDCSGLTDITIPNSITHIESYTFRGCNSLAAITIPDSVTEIGSFAFASCHSLKSIVIPKNVTNLGTNILDMNFGCIFQNCRSLTSVTIPVGVTSIYDYTFYGCESLTDIYYGGSEAQWQSVSIGSENGPLANCTIHYNSLPITVLLNNAAIAFDVQPQIINGSTMVPLRAIFEALGASVEWDNATQTVTSLKGDTKIKLTVGENVIYVNDTAVELNTSACIINGRTLVPVRAISEAYGAKVDWNGETRTVIIEG